MGSASQNVSFSGGDGAGAAVSGWGYSLVPAQLTGARISSGLFNFTLNGMEGSNYVILSSSNFSSWLPLATSAIPVGGSLLVTNQPMTNQSRLFYRAVLR